MTEIKMVTAQDSELLASIEQICRKVIREEMAQKDDELLNIKQLCERIPGLTFYTFKKLADKKRLSNVQGKYSLKAVKEAMQ